MYFHNDDTIKLEYNPVLDADITRLNAVGATTSLTLRSLDFTPSDANTVYVSKTGSDSTGDGTSANPYLTIKKAFTAVTAGKQHIIILDSGTYIEESQAIPANCIGIYAALGQMPVIQPELVTDTSNYLIDTIKASTALSTTAGDDNRIVRSAALSNGNVVVVYETSTDAGYFIIIDKAGNVIKTETAFAASNCGQPNVCAIASYFIITWEHASNNVVCIYVYDNSGSLVYSESSISADEYDGFPDVGPVGLYDEANEIALISNRFVVIYWTGSYEYFVIKDVEGNTIAGPSVLTSYRCAVYGTIVSRPKGGFIWCFDDSGTGDAGSIWGVVGQDGTVLKSASVLNSDGRGCSVTVNSDDANLITFAYITYPSFNVYLTEYNLTTYSVTKSAVQISSFSANYIIYIQAFNDGKFVLSGSYSITSSKYFILNSDWSTLYSESFSTVKGLRAIYNCYSNRILINWTNYSSPYVPYFKILGGFLTNWWTASSSLELNGIIFDNTEDYIRYFIYCSSGTLKVRWCEFWDIKYDEYADDETYPFYGIQSIATTNQIQNCKFFNNDNGVKITSNTVTISYCQFFKNLLGPAIYIIGAGTAIIINHCDFLYNYIGIKLEDNAGTEVIKNSILFYSLLFSIYAETSVTFINSVATVVSFNATAGTQVIMSNPHYVNDGYVDVDDIDLMLKQRELGYDLVSPAIGIGDDLKNAGSEDYNITGATQTWTSITVQKDRDGGVSIVFEPVGEIETELKDGSVESYRDSFIEVLNLKWRVSILEDFVKLRTLYFSAGSTVRIYLDPVTNPGTYGTYKLIYDKLNAFTKLPKLSRTGIEDVSLTFKRAYNEGA